jgi:hypothetical protein
MKDSEHQSRRTLWGRGLLTGGYVLLSVGLGVGLGYWSADMELRWLPTLVPSILLLWVAGFVLLAVGAQLRGGPGRERRLRRRSVVFASLGLLVAGAVAAVLRGLKHLAFPVQREAAEWMGDFRIKRVGKYLITPEQARAMEKKLQPGDVLLSRKNWYLSNIGLPGFWPHAIVYVGSNDQIAQTFDGDPEVSEWVAERSRPEKAFSQYLREKYPFAWRKRALSGSSGSPLSVIEAVSEGVIQNSLYGAAGDFLVSLRPRVSMVANTRVILDIFRTFVTCPTPWIRSSEDARSVAWSSQPGSWSVLDAASFFPSWANECLPGVFRLTTKSSTPSRLEFYAELFLFPRT